MARRRCGALAATIRRVIPIFPRRGTRILVTRMRSRGELAPAVGLEYIVSWIDPSGIVKVRRNGEQLDLELYQDLGDRFVIV